jgi:hypothetical protein
MIALGRVAAALALMLAAGVQPVAAQVIDPEGCATMKDQVRYLTNEGAFIQDAGLKNGVDLLANAIMVRNATCGTLGDESYPPPVASEWRAPKTRPRGGTPACSSPKKKWARP